MIGRLRTTISAKVTEPAATTSGFRRVWDRRSRSAGAGQCMRVGRGDGSAARILPGAPRDTSRSIGSPAIRSDNRANAILNAICFALPDRYWVPRSTLREVAKSDTHYHRQRRGPHSLGPRTCRSRFPNNPQWASPHVFRADLILDRHNAWCNFVFCREPANTAPRPELPARRQVSDGNSSIFFEIRTLRTGENRASPPPISTSSYPVNDCESAV